jgi:hypothetical protein
MMHLMWEKRIRVEYNGVEIYYDNPRIERYRTVPVVPRSLSKYLLSIILETNTIVHTSRKMIKV